MKLRAAAAALVLATAALLGGCSVSKEEVRKDRSEQADFFEKDVTLQDGTTVHCLFWYPGTRTASGMWCREPKKGDND